VHSVIDAYWHSAIPDPAARLRNVMERANGLLCAQNVPGVDPSNLTGATVLTGVVVENQLYLAHVGRSRAYLLRDGTLRQLTEDHSWVAEQIRAGKLDPAQALNHPRRHMITRCLGIKTPVRVDLIEQALLPGDLVLLCSDGLYRDVDDEQIALLLGRYGADSASVLVDEARRLGGHDNITTVVIGLDAVSGEDSMLDRIALLNRLGRELSMSLDLDATLQSIAQQLLALTGGERAAILVSDDGGEPMPRAQHHIEGANRVFSPSRSVVELAFQEQRPILIANAQDDPLIDTSQSIIDFALKSVLCIPLIVRDAALGVLYVDSAARTGVFDQTDIDLLVPFAAQAASAIQNAHLHQAVLTQAREIDLARARRESLFRSLSSALIAVDNAGQITDWNPAAETMLGIPSANAVNRRLMEALPPSLASWLGQLIIQADAQDTTILLANEWEGSVGGRERVILAARVARIRDQHDAADGFVFVVNDRTDMVLMDEARRAESAEHARIRELFGHYVAPSVVERMLSSTGAIQLGGSREDVSILFADVRGFTGFSERRQPEEVVAMLNQYLALATSEIFGELGTLDKFLGDGLMAIFGAPLAIAAHEIAAIRAALKMRARLAELRQETGTRVGFGIGVNTGEAIVGNIGTSQLMNYTAIGDVVNVAARLQSEARSGEVLISEATLERVREHVVVEELGPLYVKGRADAVVAYRVIELAEDARPTLAG
jgi:PAS domain S-box-containing protein